MTTDHTDQLTAQIDRFDRLRATTDDFAGEVLHELVDLTYTHRVEAVLAEEPRVEAVADVGPDGSLEGVRVCTGEGPSVDLDRDSGLWAAMEAWLADMRANWSQT